MDNVEALQLIPEKETKSAKKQQWLLIYNWIQQKQKRSWICYLKRQKIGGMHEQHILQGDRLKYYRNKLSIKDSITQPE